MPIAHEKDYPSDKLFTRSSLSFSRFIFFAILCVAMMFFDARQHQLDTVRRSLTNVVSPLHYLVSEPLNFFDWVQSSFSSHKVLVSQNKELRMQMLFLQARLQRFEALKKENSQLRELLQSAPKDEEKVLVAHLLAVMPDPYLLEIILDSGAKQGVYEGQPVLDAKGVMGQVIQVTQDTSRVVLLSDTRSAVPVEVERSGLRAIVVGLGKNDRLSLINVPDTADIQEGDLLITSGLGMRYPAGYPVGRVTKIERAPGEYFSRILVQPTAALSRSREVLLVWPQFPRHAEDVLSHRKQMKKKDS